MDGILIAVAAFLPMLLLLVVFHEYGHYLAARLCGVKPLEFGFGFPPRLFSFSTGRTWVGVVPTTELVGMAGLDELALGEWVECWSLAGPDGGLLAWRVARLGSGLREEEPGLLFHRGPVREIREKGLLVADMLWSVNALPLGGFVRLAGEYDELVAGSLAGRSRWPRAFILAAGSLVNLLLPFVLFTLFYMTPYPVEIGRITVVDRADGSPAAAAGLLEGDVIVAVAGREVATTTELGLAMARRVGAATEFTMDREGRQFAVAMTPRVRPPEGEGALGVVVDLAGARSEWRWQPPWTAAWTGLNRTADLYELLYQEVRGWLGGDRSVQVAGPVAIADVAGQVTAQQGLTGWVLMAALFSINVGLFNLLPVPMLDGGRLALLGLEGLRGGRRLSPRREGMVHAAGFMVLLAVFLVIVWRDLLSLWQ